MNLEFSENCLFVNKEFIRQFGIKSGVFLSQALEWADEEDGTFCKTMDEIKTELSLSRRELGTIRQILKENHVLHEFKAGIPCRVHYELDLKMLDTIVRGNK